MKGIIGKFFFQFGVTLSVAVLLSYLEAITLAPARCAQMLKTSREGRSGSAASSTAASRRWRAATRWLLAAAALAAGRAAGRGASLLLVVDPGRAHELPAEIVPSQDISSMLMTPADGGRLDRSTRPTQVTARPRRS